MSSQQPQTLDAPCDFASPTSRKAQKQTARISVYTKFILSSHVVLSATDIAARGLDFPAVDSFHWMRQKMRTPIYIELAGWLAMRVDEGGFGEEEDSDSKIKIRASKTQSIENQPQNLAFQDQEIKYLGQRACFFAIKKHGRIGLTGFKAFVSYVRSVHLHKDETIFKLNELLYSVLPNPSGCLEHPKIKFLDREIDKQKKNASRVGAARAVALQENTKKNRNGVRTKYDHDDGEDSITLKRADHVLSDEDAPIYPGDLSKRKLKLRRAKRAIAKNGIPKKTRLRRTRRSVQAERTEDERGKMKIAGISDKGVARKKKREKMRKRKERERGE
ncbi:hypothetical protein C0993_005928, partial [Termitomyces sp. T159_Od127]